METESPKSLAIRFSGILFRIRQLRNAVAKLARMSQVNFGGSTTLKAYARVYARRKPKYFPGRPRPRLSCSRSAPRDKTPGQFHFRRAKALKSNPLVRISNKIVNALPRPCRSAMDALRPRPEGVCRAMAVPPRQTFSARRERAAVPCHLALASRGNERLYLEAQRLAILDLLPGTHDRSL